MRRAFTLQLAAVPPLPSSAPVADTIAQEAEMTRQHLFATLRRRVVVDGERWLTQDGEDNDILGRFAHHWLKECGLAPGAEIVVAAQEDCPCNACAPGSIMLSIGGSGYHVHWARDGIWRSVGIVTCPGAGHDPSRGALPAVARIHTPPERITSAYEAKLAIAMTMDDIIFETVVAGASGGTCHARFWRCISGQFPQMTGGEVSISRASTTAAIQVHALARWNGEAYAITRCFDSYPFSVR